MKNLWYLFILAALISACSENNANMDDKPNEGQNGLNFDALDEFLKNRTDGTFCVRNSTSVAGQDTDYAEVFGQFAFENSKNSADNHATIGGIEVIASTPQSKSASKAADLFGQKIEFVISRANSKSNSSSPSVVTDSMYIPTKIKLLSPKLDYETDLIFPSMEITWNADPLNQQGVVFVLVFEILNNSNFIDQNSKDFIRTEITPDDGNYKLPASLFKSVPKGAAVSIIMTRGNFQYAHNEELDEVYSLYTHTDITFAGTYPR